MYILDCFFLVVITSSILPSNAKEFDKMNIIGGNESSTTEIKYMVAIISYTSEIHCGGGIINRNFIVSAASCFIDEDYQFYNDKFLIETLSSDPSYTSNITIRNVEIESIYVPKTYNATTHRDDIAVLKLKKPIRMKKYNLAKLKVPKLGNKQFVDKYATISGFGWDEVTVNVDKYGNTTIQGSTIGDLMSANAKVLSNDECQEHYNDHIDTMLCAKIMKNDMERFYGTCKFDEGGPLVYKNREIIGVLIQVTEACDETIDPALYTRITTQIDFLNNALSERTDNMFVKNY